MDVNVYEHNRKAWDRKVAEGDRWTRPVSSEEIERARRGDLRLLLTPTRHVPLEWFPTLDGLKVLCLASGGGQQAPLLAAAGAKVTVVDNSSKQLAQDQLVATRHGLRLELIQCSMVDLGCLADGSFQLVFHPCSNCFVPDVHPVWRECHRILEPGGALLAGFVNPVRYLFDEEGDEQDALTAQFSIPYSDTRDLPKERLKSLVRQEQPIEYGHSLEDQIGGQLLAGFSLKGFFEDRYRETAGDRLSHLLATFIATRSIKSVRD